MAFETNVKNEWRKNVVYIKKAMLNAIRLHNIDFSLIKRVKRTRLFKSNETRVQQRKMNVVPIN